MKSSSPKTGMFVVIGACFIILAVLVATPAISKLSDESMGRKLVQVMYDFHPMYMIDQEAEMRELLHDDIVNKYVLSNDSRQLAVYLRFEMQPAVPVILWQDGKSIIFTIDGPAMEPDRMFLIQFERSFNKVTKIKEMELFPIPPSGIWDYE